MEALPWIVVAGNGAALLFLVVAEVRAAGEDRRALREARDAARRARAGV
jgi:hypothetical protein